MRLYNPVYHFKRATTDIRALRHGFATLGQPQKFNSVESLSHVLHGRLLLAATIAIPATILGIVVGAFIQTQTGNFEAGLLVNLLIANIVGVIGLEILWGWLSRDLYQCRNQRGFKKMRAVMKDLGIVHLHSLIGVLIINALSMGLTTFILENIHHWQPRWNLNRYVPATLISPIFGWLLLDAPFIRHMNDLYETQARALACRYNDIILEDVAEENPQEVENVAEQVISLCTPEKVEKPAVTNEKATAPEKNGHSSEKSLGIEVPKPAPKVNKVNSGTVRRPL